MFRIFIPFAVAVLLGLYYSPVFTFIFLIIFFGLGYFIVGVKTYEACLYSIFPSPKDYNTFTPFLKNKTCLVTGCNRGIGFGIVKELVSHGANVIIACRSQLNQTIDKLQEISSKTKYNNTIKGYQIDLCDFESYLTFFNKLKKDVLKIDILVLNAGMTIHPPKQTKDGIDMMLVVNFLSNVILTKYFIKLNLLNTKNGNIPRIVFTTSDSHRWVKYQDFKKVCNYGLMEQVTYYASTKLWNQMLCNYLVQQNMNKIDCYGHCPGPVYSEIARHAPKYMRWIVAVYMWIFFQGIDRGGRHIVYSCMQPRHIYPSGTYHWMQHNKKLSADSLNETYIQSLMDHANEVIDDFEKKYGTVG